jgi:hypothetical protein
MPTDAAGIAAALRAALPPRPGKHVYGVVDAASCADLAFEAQIKHGQQIRSLFLDEVAKQAWNVAPYLVPVDPASPYLDSWAKKWGTNAGVLLVTEADVETLHRHLREIFVVQDETGQEYLFRFYDPRVLRAFLPTCTAAQRRAFYGPIEEFYVDEAQDSSSLRSHRC